MKTYLAALGRQPKISLAELESLFENVKPLGMGLATFETETLPQIDRLGGSLKIAEEITSALPRFLDGLERNGKIALGISDYTPQAKAFLAQREALRLKNQLKKRGCSVRVIPNKTPILSTATSFHNHLADPKNLELLKFKHRYFRLIGIQNINAYTARDQARPARDARVGMLPPKLAQILINLCGNLPPQSYLLDPFCGTGVLLQEAAIMGYRIQGTDLDARMIEYTKRNLEWLARGKWLQKPENYLVEQGDATHHQWQERIDLVACETYLGRPFSTIPSAIKLKAVKQECKSIILGFLENLANQIESETPVTIAVPAWLRTDGHYETLNILDEISKLRYNVVKFRNASQADLVYHREGQFVAREIIVLRKV